MDDRLARRLKEEVHAAILMLHALLWGLIDNDQAYDNRALFVELAGKVKARMAKAVELADPDREAMPRY